MRKLTVLGLVLAVGLTLAAEEWLSGSATRHIVIPNPEPAVFPPSLGILDFGLDTFRYDDNTPASAWAWNQANNGWGMKFISPADNFTLAGALIHFHATWPTPGGTRAMVRVYADDGPGGSPGTEIWHSDTLNINRGVWNWIPINEPVVGSNYYIFYIQTDSYPRCPGLSIDAYENAPSHRSWSYTAGSFAEDANRGDWAIRAVVDWTPQDVNGELRWFATNMPRDTVPNINFQVRVMLRNLGNTALPQGTPVKLYITGPQGYTYESSVNTSAALQRGQGQQINFTSWRIPTTSGAYRIRAWVEAAGEQWPANDTIIYELSVARWIEYANYNGLAYLVWPGPERATQFDPADFGVQYPVGLSRVRSQFYLHPQYPWNDTTFTFKIYGDDGATLLYESDPIEAPVGAPGPICAHDLDSMLIFPSGTFYVALAPVSGGHPSTCTDDSSDGHSFYGSAGNWTMWTQSGEFFISASVQGGVGVEEGYNPKLRNPSLILERSSNPVSHELTVRWQAPKSGPVAVNLFDATGKLVQNLYRTASARSGRFTVDLTQLAAGFYFVRLDTESGTATHKLVVSQ